MRPRWAGVPDLAWLPLGPPRRTPPPGGRIRVRFLGGRPRLGCGDGWVEFEDDTLRIVGWEYPRWVPFLRAVEIAAHAAASWNPVAALAVLPVLAVTLALVRRQAVLDVPCDDIEAAVVPSGEAHLTRRTPGPDAEIHFLLSSPDRKRVLELLRSRCPEVVRTTRARPRPRARSSRPEPHRPAAAPATVAALDEHLRRLRQLAGAARA